MGTLTLIRFLEESVVRLSGLTSQNKRIDLMNRIYRLSRTTVMRYGSFRTGDDNELFTMLIYPQITGLPSTGRKAKELLYSPSSKSSDCGLWTELVYQIKTFTKEPSNEVLMRVICKLFSSTEIIQSGLSPSEANVLMYTAI